MRMTAYANTPTASDNTYHPDGYRGLPTGAHEDPGFSDEFEAIGKYVELNLRLQIQFLRRLFVPFLRSVRKHLKMSTQVDDPSDIRPTKHQYTRNRRGSPELVRGCFKIFDTEVRCYSDQEWDDAYGSVSGSE